MWLFELLFDWIAIGLLEKIAKNARPWVIGFTLVAGILLVAALLRLLLG